ncbi:hypothetical protein O9G_000552 [Rozella allomycis CSF55]|uniref:Uncharacterized protein n=1 Tax=Rozella allomycis (strain CSF55) TaxID=988480 RepID=A0A075AVR8_ROZAC|nr:hypothetical protein O9G_000552 [Rozella allomycis CSF55]|eukprot:EPZ34365.1 hypothetical protein O9G_000552 [Rozella allomycis CSF55]
MKLMLMISTASLVAFATASSPTRDPSPIEESFLNDLEKASIKDVVPNEYFNEYLENEKSNATTTEPSSSPDALMVDSYDTNTSHENSENTTTHKEKELSDIIQEIIRELEKREKSNERVADSANTEEDDITKTENSDPNDLRLTEEEYDDFIEKMSNSGHSIRTLGSLSLFAGALLTNFIFL